MSLITLYQKLMTAVKSESNPPPHTDFVGYETLIRYLEAKKTLSVDGDLVEIGTFLGGGAFKLSKFIERSKCAKKLYVIDVFDPDFDFTSNVSGRSVSTLYRGILKRYFGKSQWQVFSDVTEGLDNVVVLRGDSAEVTIPCKSICFGFIDGNHDPEYVESDFYLIWDKLSPNGVIAFHDYEFDLPQTTEKIKALANRHFREIKTTHHDQKKHTLFMVKK